MTPEEFLESNPSASRREIMKACGCSARAARRAEEAHGLTATRAVSPARVVMGLGVGAALLLGWRATSTSLDHSTPAVNASVTEVAAIYSALDRGDRTAVPYAASQLHSPDPNLRLASLRLVAGLDPSSHAAKLLPLTDDEDPRVRSAAIQLASRLQPKSSVLRTEVAQRLVAIAVDTSRSLGERVLSLESLRKQDRVDAAALLPVLDDPRLAPRASGLLTELTGCSIAQGEGESLRQAWTRQLGAGA